MTKRSFDVRGIVEGFYGTPWTHDARADVMSFLAPRGMNAYVYAPKDDAKHRADWRVPYDATELRRFGELAQHATTLGIRFGFAISPGLDISYESDTDRSSLLAKLAPLRDAGVEWFLLLVDDIPMVPGIAPRQAALATWMQRELAIGPLTVCPTEYVGTRPSPYLTELSTGMPDGADLMWTGPTVCSPTITADDARGWTKAVNGRRVLVWDNYPVNDAFMTASLHLGAYRGREADLVDVVGGVLCNPMTQAHASLLALATAMDFCSDPDGYDADASWARAIDELGGAQAAPLGVLARACADSPVAEPASLDLFERIAAVEAAIGTKALAGALSALVGELKAAKALTAAFPVDAEADTLAAEIAPWAFAARLEAQAGLTACRLIEQVSGPEPPDPESAMHHAFAVLYLWNGARADEMVVFGPRFALYSPVIQRADGSPALDAAAAVRENQNAIDELCRLALRTYDEWRVS